MDRYHRLQVRESFFAKWNTPEREHWKYLLYWPVFGLVFFILERVWVRKVYVPSWCRLDELIPFCEYFLIPYLFWFIFLGGMVIYTLFQEPESFKGLMRFIIVSYTTALLIFVLFPNCQQLRPLVFPRDNLLTQWIAAFYQFDTNTNVCPSLHVIGSAAVMLCAWRSKRFGTPVWRVVFAVTAVLISVSTVFLKQHSALDILVAIPVCVLAWSVAYGTGREKIRARSLRLQTEKSF